MPYGLKPEQISGIKKVFEGYSGISEVLIFGSRVKGNYKPGSDVDLALKGNALKLDDILKLQNKLDELNLPYRFDLIIYGNLSDKDVIEHINRVGVIFYKAG